MITRIKLFNEALRICIKNESLPAIPEFGKIPILVPDKAKDSICTEGTYEFVEAVKYPTEGTGGIYTKEYFKSIIDYLSRYPIPGSKDGHESQSDDFYTIGGELQETSADEGVCFLRIAVPPEDFHGGSNAGLIRSLKAGVPELSLVADVEAERGQDGKAYFRKELGRPRNDIVPEGAMDVSVGNSANEMEIMALIEKGAVDMGGESTELVKNGKVFRKAAVNLQSTSDKALAGRVLNAIAVWKSKDKKNVQKSNRSNGMNKFYNAEGQEITLTYEDVVGWIKNAITNNTLTSEKLMGDIGFANKLRKSEDEQREKLASAIIEALELPAESTPQQILEAVKEVLDENEAVQEEAVEVAANGLAESKKLKNADGTEVDNPVFIYAKEKLKGLRGKQLNAAAEKLKEDPVMVSLRSKQADTRVNAKESKKENSDGADDTKTNVKIRGV